MLAPDGRCKTLDAAANGYVRSEAVGLLALRLLSSVPTAKRRSSVDAHRISGGFCALFTLFCLLNHLSSHGCKCIFNVSTPNSRHWL